MIKQLQFGLTYLFYIVARIPFPPFFKIQLIIFLCNRLSINIDEIEQPLQSFKNFNQLFIRSLKPSVRPIENQSNTIISPVDGKILEYGKFSKNSIIQAKSISYSSRDLIGSLYTKSFENGYFVTIYLAPNDCHRIFCPETGYITGFEHFPGYLYPVREPYISTKPNLYTINERISTILKTPDYEIAIVKVAATNVSNISLEFEPKLDFKKHSAISKVYDDPILWQKGKWLSTFHFGSTVILLINAPSLKWTFTDRKVQYGQSLGQLS